MTLVHEVEPNSFVVWAGEPIGGNRYPLSIEKKWPTGELAAIGLYSPAPADDIPDGKVSTGMTAQRVDGVVKWVHSLANAVGPTLAERRVLLISRIETLRLDKENGGMAFNGAPIPTDDRAKTLIMGARTAAVEQGDDYSDEWKISPGVYVPLDAAAAIALGDALLAHIRACFARERVLTQAALDASNHGAMNAAEAAIETGWPE